jgi:hypothetical protein
MLEVLDRMPREELIAYARRFGIDRPELLTRVELKDEILRVSESDDAERKRLRGWLGVARDLLASVVDKGLHLPDAAAVIRGASPSEPPVHSQRAVATVTLAEIYAGQGHVQRALRMLDEVIEKEPEHEAARQLRDRLTAKADTSPGARSAKLRRLESLSAFEAPAEEPEESPFETEMTTDAGYAESEEISDVIMLKPDLQPDLELELELEGDLSSERSEPHPATQADPFDVTQEWPITRAREPWAAEPAAPVSEREETQTSPDGGGPQTEVSPLTREIEPELSAALAASEATAPVAYDATPAAPEIATSEVAERSAAGVSAASPADAPAVDAVLLFRHDQRLYVYWQIVAETCARARSKHPGGRLCLKLISLRPRWDGAQRQEHDIDLDALQGYLAIDLDAGDAVVRAAIGWRDAGRFRPLAIAAELAGWSGHDALELREHPFDRPRTEEELATLQHLGRRALEQVRGVLG